MLFNPHPKPFNIRHKKIIPHKLHPLPQTLCKQLPAVPVLFHQSVLNGDNGIMLHQILIIIHHFLQRAQNLFPGHPALPRKYISPCFLVIKLAGGGVNGNLHLLARLVIRHLNSLHNAVQYLPGIRKIGSKTALVAYGRGQSPFFQKQLQLVINLRAHPKPFLKAAGSHGHNHKFLQINRIIRMLSAV